MSDMSKWPPSENGKFTQAWINLDKLPGSMTQGSDGLFGPIPALTHCFITTNPDDADGWRTAGKPVLAIYTRGVPASGDAQPFRLVQQLVNALCVSRPDVSIETWGQVQDAINAGRLYLTAGVAPTDQRQRFEAWADDQGFPLKRLDTSDGYLDLRTHGAWDAWQAATPGVDVPGEGKT